MEPLLLSSPLPPGEGKGEGTGQQDLENRYLLAVSYEGLKRYEEALAVLLPVVDGAEDQLKADAQLTYGSLLLSLKKYAAAIAPLEAFLQGKPEGEAALKGAGELALCYARTGRLDKAKKVYADLLEKNRQHPLIAATTEILAEAAYDANDTAWSAELSARLATAGNSAENELKGKLGLAWSQFKAGKLPEAAASFDEVLDEESARGDRGRGGAGPRPDPRTTWPERGGPGHVRPGDRQVSRQQAARRGPVVGRPAPRKAEAAPTGGRALPAFGEGISAVSQARQRALPLGLGAAELNQPEDARRLFERLHKECPQSRFWADATCRLADRELDAKHYAAAAGLVAEVLDHKAATAVAPSNSIRRSASMPCSFAARLPWPKPIGRRRAKPSRRC